MSWESELAFVSTFARDLDARPPLAEASPEDQFAHAEQIARLQDLLSLISTLPSEKRPDVIAWDEILRPLWRRLFVKGDDIDRYLLADLWRNVLLETGQVDRYLFSTVGVAAAARNFALFSEALQICREAVRVCGDLPSVNLITILNVEGSIHACVGDLDSSERLFRKTRLMADAADEGALLAVSGMSKADSVAAETLCILDCHLRRAHSITGPARERWISEAWRLVSEVERIPCGEGMKAMVAESRAELAILEGRLDEARAMLQGWLGSSAEEGPYQYSLAPMYHRLLSLIAHQEGNLREAYEWVRKGLKAVVRRSYPMEEFLLIDQAVAVIQELQETWDPKSRDEVIKDMAQLLEDKDWYTGRPHSQAVSDLSVRLGETLNASAEWDLNLGRLGTIGYLHDIGKLTIPWSLLNKIAPISRRERDILEEHSGRGADLLRRFGMGKVASAVEQHHEHLDGTGYPRGRSPEPAAAVVAVSDVYEAMVTPNRRYREPRSLDSALSELRKYSGTHFHPDVVEAMIRLNGAA